ncbi:hypothetical protein DL93DRAFT_2083724 [Clavulina sp. PMI_390]|nr:hypothetical protein DL93DRAFT_2083724 [Clavulina sp. PMI_390]
MSRNMQNDLWLRMDYDIANNVHYPNDTAVKALQRLPDYSQRYPYYYVQIDQPGEGETHAVYLNPQARNLPPDGIRYLEQDTRSIVQNPQFDLEVIESRGGFIPGKDQVAHRIRRVFRLARGGHPSMAMLHYSRGPPIQIPQHLLHQPVRAYPLRHINEPGIFVYGDRIGQKVPQQNQNRPQQIGNVAAQNAAMERMEQRREAGPRDAHPLQQYGNDDDDESYVTNRSLALARFTRNHDNLAEIFSPVAIAQIPAPPPVYENIKASDLELELEKLTAEVEALKQKKLDAEAKLGAARQRNPGAPLVDTSNEPMGMDIS